MKKAILIFTMLLTMTITAIAAPVIKATPAKGKVATNVQVKGDSLVVTDDGQSVTVTGLPMQKVKDKINKALDDTLTGGNGTTVEIGGHERELTAEDIKVISGQWAVTSQVIACASIIGLLALVLLVLFFRFLNRRNKYRVIEKAIENNYPLNELSLNDVKRSAIYVQQPVVQAPPVVHAASTHQSGQVTMGTPIQGQNAGNPIVMTDMINWRAMMPAVKWIGWGILLVLFSVAIGQGGEDPFWPIGLALVVVGVCKGFIIYKEQKMLQDAWKRAEQMQPREPMREGIPVPPAFDNDYKEDDDNTTYQPY